MCRKSLVSITSMRFEPSKRRAFASCARANTLSCPTVFVSSRFHGTIQSTHSRWVALLAMPGYQSNNSKSFFDCDVIH
jgi:hypothetical protein